MIGQPLNDRLLRLIQSFHPASIQVAGTDDPWSGQSEPTTVTIKLNPDRYSVQSIALMAAFPTVALPPEKIEGQLEEFFETGTEGVVWILQDDENFYYGGMHLIEEGVHLTITDQLGHERWSGVIKCETSARAIAAKLREAGEKKFKSITIP